MARQARVPSRRRRANDPFFADLRPAARVHLCAGIFCTFAAIGPLLSLMRSDTPEPAWTVVAWSLFSGFVAVGWALSFMWRMWLLPFVLIAQAVLPPLIGIAAGIHWRFQSYETALAAATIVLVVSGYVLSAWFLSREGTRRLRLQTEIALAQGIHERLVADIDARTDVIEVFATSRASSEMGGDLLDFIAHDGEIDLFLADVSGHGVRAGVVMAMVKSAIRTRLLSPGSLSDIFDDLNRTLADLVEPGMFVTAAAMRLTTDGAGADVALAGHLPVLRWNAADRRLESIENDGLPLAISADETYTMRATRLGPGDLLAAFTDGLTEAADARGEQFGLDSVSTAIASLAERPIREIHDALLERVRAHGPQRDDRTLLLVRIR